MSLAALRPAAPRARPVKKYWVLPAQNRAVCPEKPCPSLRTEIYGAFRMKQYALVPGGNCRVEFAKEKE